ncbi:hypothetical protein JCM8547_007268 [Rhodosporidiobolus lusitaniae]
MLDLDLLLHRLQHPHTQRTLAVVLASSAVFLSFPLLRTLRASYRSFIKMGPGALPLTAGGWLVACLVRPFGRDAEEDKRKFVEAAQLDLLRSLASSFPSRLTLAQSYLERHGPALHVSPSLLSTSSDLRLTRGEFLHLHDGPYSFLCSHSPSTSSSPSPSSSPPTFTPGPAPQSMHCILSLTDAAHVLAQGWGVRHPMSGYVAPRGLRWMQGRVPALPEGYVLVYAPRDEGELRVFERIARASVRFMVGVAEEEL